MELFMDHLDPHEEPKDVGELIDSRQYPDFWQQIENFKKFTMDVGQTAVNHNSVMVSPEDFESRMQICRECPEFNVEQKRCYLCGCYMEFKAKFTASNCPASKW